jgi:pectinesterase
MNRRISSRIAFALACAFATTSARAASPGFKPDVTVAADGSGDFKTVQEAVASIPRTNRERMIVFVKDGVYHEKVRIDASFVTLRGESRAGTRLEFAQAMGGGGPRDNLGQAVLNVNGDDIVVENLTVQNTQPTIGIHAFAIYGRGDRTVVQDCDVLSQGNDTLSLWRTSNGMFSEDAAAHVSPNGRYYHARLKVCGSVDFICPRGWCYMTDCELFEVNPRAEAAMWHDGSRDQDMKFVMRNCRFDGVEGWRFARHHHDAMIFVLDSTFSQTMRDTQPKRVIYPLNGSEPTDADRKKNKDADPTNIWGERFYYFNTHRTGGDYVWHKDNLATAPGAPRPEQITAKWTFGGKWDPENKSGPVVEKTAAKENAIAVVFSENVTVKGKPWIVLRSGGHAEYASGSGTNTLSFTVPAGARAEAAKLDLQGGAVIATEAATTLRHADLTLR